mmetsp:Transcript_25558/g.55877  ORF Transcript_25558/g.55877 Transcript_25558/m.55877 type:complete len:398 (+) Transcript_25558:333-1526(+)
MNASAAEWRPGGLKNIDHDSKRPETFYQFSSLDDDLATLALSFVSDVPFEIDEANSRSNLTHVIPLVSKRFHGLVSPNDFLWKDGLARLVKKEPYVWHAGVNKIISSAGDQVSETRNNNNERERIGVGATNDGERVFVVAERADDGNDVNDKAEASDGATPGGGSAQARAPEQSIDKLIDNACKSLSVDGIASSCQRLFREVVSKHIRFTGPIFYMPGNVRIGEEFGLHFFEPRYRLLISEVMAPFPVNFRRGDPIQLDSRVREFPKFIYGHSPPLQPGAPACIVEVRQCLINPNGTADVFLCPTSYIWMEQLWERPNSGALYEGRGIRMTSPSSRALERQTMEAEARRIAEQGMFPVGDHTEIVQALLQHLSDHGGNGHFDEEGNDEEEDAEHVMS